LAIKELKENQNTIYSLGDLIHNKQVVQELNKLGAKPIKNISEINNTQNHDSIIIRAHGISKETNKEIQNKGLKIIDATCPFVKIPQNAVKEYAQKGYFIFIAGDEGHPEVEGIKSYVDLKQRLIVKDENQLNSKKQLKTWPKKATLVSQTTLSFEIFSKIALFLMKEIEELVIINSICDATNIRQKETRELAQKSDIMIVIGGRHSANTKRLLQISKEYTKSIQIETESELQKEWFKEAENIGITAGASTPNSIIEKVENKIKDFFYGEIYE
jgi:4-hydroxy-3-methylbut-2-enyl diphosphate reductase